MKNGVYGPITGKLCGTVSYTRLGVPVIRSASRPRSKPSTQKQLAVQKAFNLVNEFVTAVNSFTNVGFKPKSRKTPGRTPNNEAMSANLKAIITGEYPDLSIDYAKVRLSDGQLPLGENITVSMDSGILYYTWQNQPTIAYPRLTDQAMLLAYFPETKRVAMMPGSARRANGQDSLNLYLEMGNRETYLEAYIAFISNDREEVSDSRYLGRIEL